MNREGLVELTRSRVRCPACGEEVLAVASDGWVRGYCTVARQRVNFLAEIQPICIGKNPAAETAEISASVKKQLQDPDPGEVVRAARGQNHRHPTGVQDKLWQNIPHPAQRRC